MQLTDSQMSAQGLAPRISAGVLDQGAVLLDLESKYFFLVNASGWAILQLLEAGVAVGDLPTRCRAWGGDDEGVAAFLARVDEYALVEPSTPIGKAESVVFEGSWTAPTIERQSDPLHQVVVSAFDPTIPLAE